VLTIRFGPEPAVQLQRHTGMPPALLGAAGGNLYLASVEPAGFVIHRNDLLRTGTLGARR
jgi:hypothetical protein